MATTDKDINLFQLDKELGFEGLVADFTDPKNKIIKPADNSTVTEAQLEAAIVAHIAGPSDAEIRLSNRQEGLAKLKELGFTNDQISALLNI
jgi:DNA-binding NarL/FixJ family response regulator